PKGASTPEWAKRYPPLVTLLAALAIAIIVLPSSLNQPQTNPSQTLELAPVPPTNEKPPPIGNLNQLGLGRSSGVSAGGALGEGSGLDAGGGLPGATDGPGSRGRDQSTKNCVKLADGRRHQTEDPLSPPCNAFFDGDNGGNTYDGVTKDEIRILFYENGASFYTPTARGTDTEPASELRDLDEAPRQGELGIETTRRAWAKYFEDRYQLYNRRAHFYIYYGSGSGTPEARQADAAQAYAQVKPFATISSTGLSGASDDFLVYMAKRGVLNFGSFSGRTQAFFNQFPKRIWGYPPTLEQMGAMYSDFVCKTVVPYKTSFGGPGTPAGQKRKFGIVRTRDATYPNLPKLAAAVKSKVRACGGDVIEYEATFPKNGFFTDTQSPPQYATNDMLKMKGENVTTLLWAGGVETKYSAAATQVGYQPEWVTLGDGLQEANNYGQGQDQNTWSHAWTLTPTVKIVPLTSQICYQAYRSVDPNAPESDVGGFACLDYDNLRQIFTGIQVAGPKLGPTSIDKGYHAIPSIESEDPRLPACYYEPGDYTCVKDTQAMWYDPQGIEPGGQTAGCYRMVLGGKRFRSGTWPARDIISLQDRSKDECNAYDQTQYINNRPPDPNGG
ncbi:MAG: hypothetical protein H0W70_10685, partial [Actinobacteria bacterium]|nr:hypothetical protein [Actinomycetota bacterium]